ncbi:MAG: hypothetical protein QXI41_00410 [Candidatus Pacearchaeota archaeon]
MKNFQESMLKEKLQKLQKEATRAVFLFLLGLLGCTHYHYYFPSQPLQQAPKQEVICVCKQHQTSEKSKEPRYWYWMDSYGKPTYGGFDFDPRLGLKKQVKILYDLFFSATRICKNRISCMEQLIDGEVREIITKYGLKVKPGQEIEFELSFPEYMKK